jgi:heme exporter protein D
MADFFAMGGYGAYVWTSYGLFAIVLLADALAPVLARRRALRDLRGRVKRESRKTSNRNSPPRAENPA